MHKSNNLIVYIRFYLQFVNKCVYYTKKNNGKNIWSYQKYFISLQRSQRYGN